MKAFELSNVAREIYEYLRLHPGAKDSAEGVARWWVKADMPRVRGALEELTERKLICRREGARRDLYYAVEQAENEPHPDPTEPVAEQDICRSSAAVPCGAIQSAKSLLDLTEEFASLNNAKILFGGRLAPQSESRWEQLKGFYDALMGNSAVTEPPLRHFPTDDIKKRVQSRARLRVQAELGISIKQNSHYLSAQAMNVSCGGLLVATQKVIEVGSPLTMCLSTIGRGLVIDGEVVWSSGTSAEERAFQDKMGVRFSGLREADRKKIDAFVVEVLEKHLLTFNPAALGPEFVQREQLVL